MKRLKYYHFNSILDVLLSELDVIKGHLLVGEAVYLVAVHLLGFDEVY